MRKKNPGCRRAFTLIELLTVILIIVLLAALLMPALMAARKRAKTVQCAHNQRQLGVGFTAYTTDHNGYFPYSSPECMLIWLGYWTGTQWEDRPDNTADWPQYGQPFRSSFMRSSACATDWQAFLAPYFSTKASYYSQMMRCPSNPWPFPNASTTSYGMNGSMFPMNYRCSSMSTLFECALLAPTYPVERATPATPSGWNKAVHLTDINRPGSVALVGEIPICPSGVANPWGTGGLPGGYIGRTIWMCAATPSPGSVLCDGSNWFPTHKEWRRPDCNAFIATWHNQGMNTLFVDGHVERVSKTTLMDYSLQAQSNLWNVGVSGSSGGPNPTPGGIFWMDGKTAWSGAYGWYTGQWPSPPYALPQRVAYP
ncbi:MAG: hypothetical protein PCFJNLEI_02639 [Verrucomicrobiae bacterium]|nr:hypothetical protein [Verrucomicrobiae bacterium]